MYPRNTVATPQLSPALASAVAHQLDRVVQRADSPMFQVDGPRANISVRCTTQALQAGLLFSSAVEGGAAAGSTPSAIRGCETTPWNLQLDRRLVRLLPIGARGHLCMRCHNSSLAAGGSSLDEVRRQRQQPGTECSCGGAALTCREWGERGSVSRGNRCGENVHTAARQSARGWLFPAASTASPRCWRPLAHTAVGQSHCNSAQGSLQVARQRTFTKLFKPQHRCRPFETGKQRIGASTWH